MSTPTIHIVDDEETLRRSLARLLKSHGHATELFASADAFIAAGLQDRVGCLVLDVHMPGLNGLELQEAMARAPLSPAHHLPHRARRHSDQRAGHERRAPRIS
jgi:two-component system response regulator FixJ